MDLEAMKKKFLDFADGDDKLSRPEMRKFMSQVLHLELSDMVVDSLFDSKDKSGDDYISVDEWLDSPDRIPLRDIGEEEAHIKFANLDTDGSGTLNRAELKQMLIEKLQCHLEEEQIDELLTSVDVSGDGKIGFKEFYNAFFAMVTKM